TTGSGGPFINITNETASNESYNWTVPDAIGSNLYVIVRDYDNPAVNDTSNNPFAVKGSILVNYPNASSGNWTVAQAEYVNWTPTGNYTQDVLIEYDNGTGWNTLGTQSPGANGVLQSFTLPANVPNDITTSARARVSTNESNSSINVNNESNTYRIMGTVDITVPSSGNILYVNDTTKYINWSSNGSITPIDILYSVNNGVTWYDIERDYSPANPGTGDTHNYSWTPIPDRKNESSCIIKIIHNITGMGDVNDTSDTFSVLPVISVTKPETGDYVYAGSTNKTINWTYTGTKISTVDIYFKNDTGLWELLPSGGGVSVGSGGDGSFTWSPAPSYKKTNSQIRVWGNTTNNVSNTSDLFDIVGSLAVTAPNGGQNWAVGSSPLITWSRDSVTLVNISYSTDGGGSWADLQNNFDTSSITQWQWNIPNETNVSNNFYVKIVDAQDADATNDTSDSNSSVMSSFDVTDPEETTDFIIAGDSCDITWGYQPVSAANKSDNIILRYSTDGGGSWNDIPGANTTPNDGGFTWNNINGTVLSN
ncbi:MAG: hypothetical protein KAQ99_02955, partial [Candidatus Aureabacteria bacterium]|nr:hypothetical protein [Candidatus Auribacterota bacterium]